MQRVAISAFLRLGRVLSLVMLAILGTVLLTRFAPGYFADSRELDASHAAGAQAELSQMRRTQGSVDGLLRHEARQWLHGDFGVSRHYLVPVGGLIQERATTSLRLLLKGTLLGWSLAIAFSLLCGMRRTSSGETLISAGTALMLSLPIGALATLSLLLNIAGAVSVLALLIGVRDFKLLYRLFRASWGAPYLLYARAQGLSTSQLIGHLFASSRQELFALGMTSFTLALSALVPVEVVFDQPGLGQLAWDAAMNRDLPVLVAVTALLAACVGLAGILAGSRPPPEMLTCA